MYGNIGECLFLPLSMLLIVESCPNQIHIETSILGRGKFPPPSILLATDQSMSRGILGSASVIVSQSNYLTNETANIFSRSN